MLGNERKLVQYGSGKQCSVSVRGEHALCRRLAKFLQDAVAQSLGIAFARFRKTNDLVCDYFVGKVAAIKCCSFRRRSRKVHRDQHFDVQKSSRRGKKGLAAYS